MAKQTNITKNEEIANRLFGDFPILDIFTDPFGIIHLYATLDEKLAQFLMSRMRHNRPFDSYQVTRLNRDMKHDEFFYLCEPVHIDASGQVFNFHHRLKAFLLTCKELPGFTIPVEICVGFEFPGFEKLDKTKPRSRGQDMKLRHISYYNFQATSVPYILSFLEVKDFTRDGICTVTSSECIEFLNNHPEVAAYATQIANRQKLALPASWLIALRYIYGLVDQSDAETFIIQQIVEERKLDVGMPAYAFKLWAERKVLKGPVAHRLGACTLTEMFLRFRKGETVKLCRSVFQMPNLGI
jgi:hypothetical protein